MKSLHTRLLLPIALFTCIAGLQAQPTFSSLTMLNPSASNGSSAIAINASGQILIEGRDDNLYLWSNGAATQITNDFGSGRVSAPVHGLNDSGQVVGFAENEEDRHSFVWSSGTGMTEFFVGDIDEVQGINNSGAIVGRAANNGFVFSGGSTTALASPYNNGSTAYAINSSGQVAGVVSDENFNGAAVRWESNGDVTVISDAGLVFVADINDSGHVVGGSYDEATDAFVAYHWDGTTMNSIGSLKEGDETGALAINGLGDVVGYNEGLNDQAILYTADTLYDLNALAAGFLVEIGGETAGFVRLESANDINDAGQIVGQGLYYDGFDVFERGFFLDNSAAIPEPATATALAGLCTLGIAACARRRRQNV
jgi:probable HAF family extracellular repeat protein